MTGWNLSPRARFDPPIRPKLGFSGFRTVAITVTLILAVALCVVLFVKQNVHDHLRARITDALNERLRGIGYTARLESARWIEGSGLHLEGLSIKQNIDSQSNGLISIGKIFARSSFRLNHILSGKPRLESLLIEDLRAHLSRSDKGPWNIEPVIQALLPQDAQSLDTFPIRLRRAQVSLDGRALGIDQNLVINGINLDFHHDSNSSWDRVAVGHFSGPLIERVEFQLWIDSHRQRWQSRLSVNKIQLTGELGGLVPSDLKPQLEIIKSLQGEISLVGEASGSMDLKQVPAFQVKGSASRLQWLHPSAPYPVHNGRLSFTADNSGLRISEASADVGYGHLKFAFQRSGWLIHQGWHLSGEAQDIELTPRLVQWLPAKMQKAWSEYDPTGRVNIDFTLHHRNGKTTHEIRSRVVDGSFSYHRFPFRINQCSGRLNWIDDVMTIDLHALESQQPVRITGRISQPGNDWTGYINVECDGYLPLNEKLFRAFKYRPNLERTLRQFHSHGHFGVVGRLERHDPSVDKPRLTYHVDIKQANVRYENFDYPFYNVNGRIRVVNDSAFFESFIANNGQVTCNGHWYPESGLKLRFHAQTVLLDDELRSALPGYLQDCWSQLRPSGTVDHVALDWQFDHHTGKIKTTIDAEIYPGNAKRQSSVSLRPVWFPY